MIVNKVKFLWGVLIFVFAVRVVYFLAQPDFSTDHITQMALAENFMNGNGVSLAYVSDNDISKVNYKVHIQWPPAYIIVLSILTFITNNFILSSFIIHIFSIITLSVLTYKIFTFYNDIIYGDFILLLISFILIVPSIYNNLNSILLLPPVLILLSFYLFIKYYYFTNKDLKILLFASFISALNFWFHYSYFLLTFFIPIILIYLKFKNKEYEKFHHIIFSLLIILIIDLLLLAYNYLLSGNINYMDNPNVWDKGFFISNLILIDPFFVQIFFKSAYLIQFFGDSIILKILLQFFSISILIFIFIQLKTLQSKISSNIKSKFSFLLSVLLTIFVLNILLLLFLSLRYYEIPRPGWTHIGDPRYLGVVYISIIFVIFIICFNKITYDSILSKVFRTLLIVFFVLNVVLNIYNIKQHLPMPMFNNQILVNEDNLKDLYNSIREEKESGKKVIFIDNGATVRQFRMAAYAGAILCDSSYFNNKKLETSEEVVCIFPVLNTNMREIDSNLLQFGMENEYIKVGEIYNQTLYKIILKPKYE